MWTPSDVGRWLWSTLLPGNWSSDSLLNALPWDLGTSQALVAWIVVIGGLLGAYRWGYVANGEARAKQQGMTSCVVCSGTGTIRVVSSRSLKTLFGLRRRQDCWLCHGAGVKVDH